MSRRGARPVMGRAVPVRAWLGRYRFAGPEPKCGIHKDLSFSAPERTFGEAVALRILDREGWQESETAATSKEMQC
jgi:hypothetical protein